MADEWKAIYTDPDRHRKLKREAVDTDAEIVEIVTAALDAFLKLPKEERRALIDKARR